MNNCNLIILYGTMSEFVYLQRPVKHHIACVKLISFYVMLCELFRNKFTLYVNVHQYKPCSKRINILMNESNPNVLHEN